MTLTALRARVLLHAPINTQEVPPNLLPQMASRVRRPFAGSIANADLHRRGRRLRNETGTAAAVAPALAGARAVPEGAAGPGTKPNSAADGTAEGGTTSAFKPAADTFEEAGASADRDTSAGAVAAAGVFADADGIADAAAGRRKCHCR